MNYIFLLKDSFFIESDQFLATCQIACWFTGISGISFQEYLMRGYNNQQKYFYFTNST